MDRRKALKNMGLALGYTVATPTLVGIVQSCKNETALLWTPDFLTKDEGSVLTHLVDIILPATDTPAASELQVHLFIDRFANEVMEKEQQDLFKMGMGKFIDRALSSSGKESAIDLEPSDLESTLASVLKISKEKQAQNEEALEAYIKAMAKSDGNAKINDEVATYAFANGLRGLTIWGYKTTEYIGEEVLAYLPVPGAYVACGDTQELTDGKAWSL